MELEAKFGRLENEKGLTYSDSMSDLSDIDYDFSDDEKKKDPENQEWTIINSILPSYLDNLAE